MLSFELDMNEIVGGINITVDFPSSHNNIITICRDQPSMTRLHVPQETNTYKGHHNIMQIITDLY